MPFSRYPSGSCPCQVSLPFELRHFPAGSLSPLSRIEFVSYRLVVLLRLLPTPPHDDAVAVEYGPENVCPVGTFTLLFKCAYERTGSGLRDHGGSSHTGTQGFLCWSLLHDSSSCIDSTHPPSWRAFAPPALPGFFTTTPPLTSAGLLPDRPFADLLALRHLNFPPFHLQPPQGLTRCLFHVTHQALVRVRFPFHSSFAISQQARCPL